MDFEQCYRAIDSRDARFDGQFVTAVSSTRIYCRPSCPARTPRRSNVTFYATSAAAHEAGYRACKRCLPEAVPGTPQWNVRSDVAARAMRLIIDGTVERGGVDLLARRLGYSSRQLNRILVAELGAGPLALARASRAQTARTLLTSTTLPIADVAFASGFASIRQFNETVSQIFDLTPSQLRATARTAKAHTVDRAPTGTIGSTLTLKLPLRPPYDPGIFGFLAARAVDGVERAGEHSYSRTLSLAHGPAAFTVSIPASLQHLPQLEQAQAITALDLTSTVSDLRDLPSLLARTRRLFDLDADPVAIDRGLGIPLAEATARIPGLRVPGAVDGTEMLLRAMIGQQITVVAARTMLHQIATLGDAYPAVTPLPPASAAAEQPTDNIERPDTPPLSRLFPTAAQIADHAEPMLRGPARRRESILNVMRLLAAGAESPDAGRSEGEGALVFGVQDDRASLEASLVPLPGIGPWTVGYLAMRLLGDPDVFLANDVAVKTGMAALGVLPEAVADLAPWRSYATAHFWRAASLRTSARTTAQRSRKDLS
ncbi:DNA-3-methyladenine glycosylase 2 family protein [Psychromicrobium xiongbiense]|uniref:DNA-3-methyladenine glycosylase 2 family protein n=1 Tax=Psychromicrobium xiongbiense TaxID=3051184 RepID=UPI0025538D70|nr:Ada metal-binding domain-containing protein [Psychromicrobium sp. YIM S02556]